MSQEPSLDSRGDRDLLACFVADGRQEAFAALVRRHGDMVLRVCRARLGNAADAEDAAQAVFLTLARRSSSLTRHETLAGWLYRVAWYVAGNAARVRLTRLRHEQEAARMGQPANNPASDLPIPPEALYAGLFALAEKYRLPLILHHLQGKTEAETAALLRISVSAASVRLARGRQKLRSQLARLGAVSTVALAAALSAPASAVPPAFVTTATQTAVSALVGQATTTAASATVAALSKGAIHMLFMAKMKLAAMVTAAVLLVGGAGVGTYLAAADGAARTPSPAVLQAPTVPVVGPATAPVAFGPVARVLHYVNWGPGEDDRETRDLKLPSGRTLIAAVGHRIRIDLDNAVEGAGWEPGGTEIQGKSVAAIDFPRRGNCDEFAAAGNAPPPTAVGNYAWNYVCKQPGISTVRLVQVQPGGPAPVRRAATAKLAEFVLTVDVREKWPKPAIKDGLAVTVIPAKAVFPPGEVRFVVSLRNTSDKIIRLYEQKQQWARPELHVLIRDRNGPKSYSMALNQPGKNVLWVLRSLKPGDSMPMELASDRVMGEDRPGGKGVPKVGPLPAGDYEVTVELRLVDFATIRVAVAQYEAEARAAAALGRDAVAVPALPEQAAVWSGQITSEPARFSVADPAAATQPADGGIAQDKAEAIALEAVMAYFKDDPIRQKALRVSVPMRKVEEGGKTYWLVEYFGSNGKAKIATWTQVRVDAQTGAATVRPAPGKFGA